MHVAEFYLYTKYELKVFQKLFILLKFSLFGTIAILLILLLPTSASAAPYGECAYGSYLFNGQCVRSNPPSDGGGSGSTTGSKTCTGQVPASAPNLFQIDTTGSTATLYFAPAANPYTDYYVSFGDGTNNEGYGAQFALSQTTGALRYDIYHLKNNAVYTFKVRAGNGCKPGPWSNTISARTGGRNSKTITKYYPNNQAKYAFFASNTLTGIGGSLKKAFPQFAPATGRGKTNSAKQVSPAKTNPASISKTTTAKQSPTPQKRCFWFICW